MWGGGVASYTPLPPTSRFRNSLCKDDSALFSKFIHSVGSPFSGLFFSHEYATSQTGKSGRGCRVRKTRTWKKGEEGGGGDMFDFYLLTFNIPPVQTDQHTTGNIFPMFPPPAFFTHMNIVHYSVHINMYTFTYVGILQSVFTASLHSFYVCELVEQRYTKHSINFWSLIQLVSSDLSKVIYIYLSVYVHHTIPYTMFTVQTSFKPLLLNGGGSKIRL